MYRAYEKRVNKLKDSDIVMHHAQPVSSEQAEATAAAGDPLGGREDSEESISRMVKELTAVYVVLFDCIFLLKSTCAYQRKPCQKLDGAEG